MSARCRYEMVTIIAAAAQRSEDGLMAGSAHDSAGDGAVRVSSRLRVFAVALGFVAVSCALPVAAAVRVTVRVAHDTPATCGADSCAFDGFAVFFSDVFAATVIVLGVLLAGVFSVSRFRRSSPRRAVAIGSVAAIPGLALTSLMVLHV